MKTLAAVFCFLLTAFSLIATAQAAPKEPNGFLDMRWGANLTELQRSKQLVLTKENDGSGASLYALQNANMRFGKATLSGIHCSFNQERLQGVILLFAGAKNYAAIKDEATSRYGQPIKVDQKGGEMFTWPGEVTSIILSYTKGSESGFLFLKPKKPLPKVAAPKNAPQEKKTTPPAAPGRNNALDALDQASQGHTRAVPPTSSSVNDPRYGRNVPVSPREQASTIAVISTEVQGLIDRDQALTRLCWDTVGPTADQACTEMKENARRLQDMGWCMQPGEAKDGLQVIWSRCASGPVTPTQPVYPSSSVAPAQPVYTDQSTYGAPVEPAMPSSPAPPQPSEPTKGATCRLVGELFAATADMRERGVTPIAAEEELLQMQTSRGQQLPIENIRETVELVYFDSRYNTQPRNLLSSQVEAECHGGTGPYLQPLPAR